MSAPRTSGLSLDQGPPLSVPISFFALAPVACVAAGGILVMQGIAPFRAPGQPATTVLTHVATLGLLLPVMVGALYQLIPVVAGAAVPAPTLSRVVLVGVAGGGTSLVAGLGGAGPLATLAGGALLGAAILLFVGQASVGLARSPASTPTAWGMRLAIAALVVLVSLGLSMAAVRGGLWGLPGEVTNWQTWRVAHLGVAILVWVGGLLAAVSWQVVPMFYLAQEVPPRARWTVLGMQAASLVALPVAALSGAGPGWAAAAAAPAAVATWSMHPALTLRSIRQRRRKRRDWSLRAWQAGSWVALTLPVVAGLALWRPEPRVDVVFGWLALWGWAGLLIHGMLSRIVPFLVWFHRFSHRVGLEDVPSMKELLPDRRVRVGVLLHGATTAVGAVAIASGWPALARLTGLGLVATGLWIGGWLIAVSRVR